jgi:hypothetical protein
MRNHNPHLVFHVRREIVKEVDEYAYNDDFVYENDIDRIVLVANSVVVVDYDYDDGRKLPTKPPTDMTMTKTKTLAMWKLLERQMTTTTTTMLAQLMREGEWPGEKSVGAVSASL